MNGAEPTWVAPEQPPAPEPGPPNGERVGSQSAVKEEDGELVVNVWLHSFSKKLEFGAAGNSLAPS